MTKSRPKRQMRLRVEPGFRVFLYLGFVGCVIDTIALLGWGGAWWAPMFGSVAFGIPAVMAYLTEEENQQNLQVVRMNQAIRANDEDPDSWDSAMNDGGDPTVPPAPRERNR